MCARIHVGAAVAAAFAINSPTYFAAAVFVQPRTDLPAFERAYKKLLAKIPCWRLCSAPQELALCQKLLPEKAGASPACDSRVTMIDDFLATPSKGRLVPVSSLLVHPQLHAWLISFVQPCDLSEMRPPIDPVSRMNAAAEFAAEARDVLDTYGRGRDLRAFEKEVAAFLGKAEGLFFTTGTCANQAAVRAAVELSKSV